MTRFRGCPGNSHFGGLINVFMSEAQERFSEGWNKSGKPHQIDGNLYTDFLLKKEKSKDRT